MLDQNLLVYGDSGRYRMVQVRVGSRGDEQPHGGPREGHITVMDTPRRNSPLIRLFPGVIDHKDGACH